MPCRGETNGALTALSGDVLLCIVASYDSTSTVSQPKIRLNAFVYCKYSNKFERYVQAK